MGVTRTCQKLILTHAGRRLLFGQPSEASRSRFVADIEAALLEVQERAQRAARSRPEEQQLSLF